MGSAERFRFGDATLENVPVTTLASLTGQQDLIIFGTNVLEQFLATLDYPSRRLILSPRGDAAARKEHLRRLPRARVAVPFHLWSDHYMFARGGVGGHRDLNFFVDSGLVLVVGDGERGTRQAAFTASVGRLREWGVIHDGARTLAHPGGEIVDPGEDLVLSLGGVEQRGHLFGQTQYPESFGGVRIDGLISHGFLRRYSWTIDFENTEYLFSGEADAASP